MSSVQEDCIFCKKINCKILKQLKYFFIIRDTAYPVTEHHTLIITNRHVSDFFELSEEENIELNQILKDQKKELKDLDSKSLDLMLALISVRMLVNQLCTVIFI